MQSRAPSSVIVPFRLPSPAFLVHFPKQYLRTSAPAPASAPGGFARRPAAGPAHTRDPPVCEPPRIPLACRSGSLRSVFADPGFKFKSLGKHRHAIGRAAGGRLRRGRPARGRSPRRSRSRPARCRARRPAKTSRIALRLALISVHSVLSASDCSTSSLLTGSAGAAAGNRWRSVQFDLRGGARRPARSKSHQISGQDQEQDGRRHG